MWAQDASANQSLTGDISWPIRPQDTHYNGVWVQSEVQLLASVKSRGSHLIIQSQQLPPPTSPFRVSRRY